MIKKIVCMVFVLTLSSCSTMSAKERTRYIQIKSKDFEISRKLSIPNEDSDRVTLERSNSFAKLDHMIICPVLDWGGFIHSITTISVDGDNVGFEFSDVQVQGAARVDRIASKYYIKSKKDFETVFDQCLKPYANNY